MHVEAPSLPSWTHWEKRQHHALIALAILTSAGVAAAASNERRMFLMPATPQALTAIAMPEPTTLRSPVMGYLGDGCQPDLDIASGSIARAIDQHDCGKDRKRAAETAGSDTPPSAFFAMPDTPVVLTDTPLPVIAELSPDPQTIPIVGGNPYAGPIHTAGGTPAALLTGVPEPASWAMMIAGFALAGGSLRRPRRGAASVSPA